MGEAKHRRRNAVPTVYHHTSTLRTNLIWMSGYVEVEGKGEPALHPQLGEIRTNALGRRAMKDFPPVAWFTSRVDVPKCLIETTMFFVDKNTGEERRLELEAKEAHAIALNRIALGFRVSDIPVVRWSEHPGYDTGEGRDLDASARAAGDDPDEWWVSEVPVDMMKIAELWGSRRRFDPKMERQDKYLEEVRKMVMACRTQKGVFIPPAWLRTEQAAELARRLGVPIMNPRG